MVLSLSRYWIDHYKIYVGFEFNIFVIEYEIEILRGEAWQSLILMVFYDMFILLLVYSSLNSFFPNIRKLILYNIFYNIILPDNVFKLFTNNSVL